MHEACLNGHPVVVSILLDHRADVTAKLSDGRNPLDCAIDQDEPECVQAILEHDSWKEALRNAYIDPVTGKSKTLQHSKAENSWLLTRMIAITGHGH